MTKDSQTTDPLPDEPHHTQCPVLHRWCYREACDSALGCIEPRRHPSLWGCLIRAFRRST